VEAVRFISRLVASCTGAWVGIAVLDSWGLGIREADLLMFIFAAASAASGWFGVIGGG